MQTQILLSQYLTSNYHKNWIYYMDIEHDFNPKKFLINPDKLQQFECIICNGKTMHILRCQTCKKYYCNQCSIDIKTNSNRCPLRCTNQEFKLERVTELKLSFRCPFSKKCLSVINSTKQFEEHDRVCQFIDEGQKAEQRKKWDFLCKNNHHLQIKIGSYRQLIQRSQCAQCHQYTVSRAICRKCNCSYCNYCRPFPISELKCPIGHDLVKRRTGTLSYRCDMCQLSPKVLGIDILDDFICNFGICQICYSNWPSFPNKIQYEDNFNEYCVYIDKLGANSTPEIKSQHKLEVMGKIQQKTCSKCDKKTLCYKNCKKCQTFYCYNCKRFEVFQKLMCLKEHSLIKIDQLPEMSGKVQCYSCLINSKNKNSIKNIYKDFQCNITLCTQCIEDAVAYNNDVFFKDISFQISPCSFDSTHLLFYVFNSHNYTSACSLCSVESIIKFNCGMCEVAKFFCCRCIRPKNVGKCYCKKELVKSKSGEKRCMACNKFGQVFECSICNYQICGECMEKMKK